VPQQNLFSRVAGDPHQLLAKLSGAMASLPDA